MMLVMATTDFVVQGRSFEGFPLLVGDDGWPVEPAQSFLWHALVISSGSDSPLTWETYGRRLYDYFAFLNANGLSWDAALTAQGLTPLARYRDWSLTELKLNRSTVNQRLSLVVKFYEWCKAQGHIDHLPFSRASVRATSRNGFLSHAAAPQTAQGKPSILVKSYKSPLKFLTKEQTLACGSAELDPSHALLFHLMVRTGLRSCEARSFPIKYVFNPNARNGLKKGQMIRVDLSPKDMTIKFDKPRAIDVPWSLMEDLWAYSLHQRQVRLSRLEPNAPPPGELILTQTGAAFSKGAIVDAMGAISKKVGFRFNAHMLRHTYGTYTLAALRKSASFEGEPLLYVRDRMGHSDVQTTAIYLHVINQLDAQLALAHEDEIDRLLASKPQAD